MNNSVKVVVPARFGSTRLEGKPLLTIKNKPIFWHVFQKILSAGVNINDTLLATDNIKIAEEAIRLNIPYIMTNVSHSSGTDRLNEVASKLKWGDDVLVVNVQGDEPLIPSELISQLVHFSVANRQFDISTVVCPLVKKEDVANPNVVKVAMGCNDRAVYFSRAPIPFNRDNYQSISGLYRHVGIYSYSVKCLRLLCSHEESNIERIEKLEQLRALSNGFSIGATITQTAPPHGIDTFEDYLRIRNLMEK